MQIKTKKYSNGYDLFNGKFFTKDERNKNISDYHEQCKSEIGKLLDSSRVFQDLKMEGKDIQIIKEIWCNLKFNSQKGLSAEKKKQFLSDIADPEFKVCYDYILKEFEFHPAYKDALSGHFFFDACLIDAIYMYKGKEVIKAELGKNFSG